MDPASYNGRLNALESEGKVRWSSPSNIALTKYWGKHDNQLPRNPSISFTLSQAKTLSEVAFKPAQRPGEPSVSLFFEGKINEAFGQRIRGFLLKNKEVLPYIDAFDWSIRTENTFPHSSGIASSASAMSCLVMALVDIENQYLGADRSAEDQLKRASYLSRLASGSASRSVYPNCAEWGHCEGIEGSSDLFAIPGEDWLNEAFVGYHDDILIVSAEEKEVSSSLGHQMMATNAYRDIRYRQANENTIELKSVLQSGDLDRFIEITEGEALTLHALMMTSHPSFILMKPNSLEVIERIRNFRKESGVPICFTLDAGPNVHILYPDRFADVCRSFITSELQQFGSQLIEDHMGAGPERLEA